VALAALVTARTAPSAPATHAGGGPRAMFRAGSLRRWIGAEVIAYAGWSALLTFVGAFFVERLGVSEADVGWLLAAGAGAFFVASTHSAPLVERVARQRLVAAAALAMAALLVGEFRLADPAAAVAGFCVIGLVAGIRTPASGGLGLAQLPDQPGAAMAARTAATQLGYLAGAVIGGAVIATSGYPALGVVLAAAMVASAALILRVSAPAESSMLEARPAGA
jgi:predicted MFS family arabinose efflux permease